MDSNFIIAETCSSYSSKFGVDPPKEWSDEQQIYRYFQTFKRPRSMEPSNYETKLQFWSHLISKRCSALRIAVVSDSSLRSPFERYFEAEGRTLQPLCLDTVLAEMQAAGNLCTKSELYSRQSGILARAASASFEWLVKKPAVWTWKSLTGGQENSVANSPVPHLGKDVELVDPDLAIDFAQHFLQHIRKQHRVRLAPHLPVILKEQYIEQLNNYFEHEPTRYLVEELLRRRGEVNEECVSSGVNVITLSDSAATKPLSMEEKRILEGIVKVRRTIEDLETEENYLRTRVAERKQQAKTLLQEGRRDEALGLMRRSKTAEQRLAQKGDQLTNLENMLVNIETCKNDDQVVAALESAGKILKERNDVAAADRAGDAMAAAKDALAEQHEISEALGSGGLSRPDDSLDQDELTSELDELLKDDDAVATAKSTDEEKRLNRLQKLTGDLDEMLAELDVEGLPDVSSLPLPEATISRPEHNRRQTILP